MSLFLRVAGVLLVAASTLAADRVDPLARARTLYNDGDYDAALVAADEGRRAPERADSADLIAARAYIEKFRTTSSNGDLEGARERLRRVNPARLTKTERVELLVGMGEALYFDGSAGAAGEVFDSVLSDSNLAPREHERVLDWWASALDEDTRRRSDAERSAVYQRIRDRMRLELGKNQDSATASYWLVAAARRQGDLQGAWDAAHAGWVRASLAANRGKDLRADLDRLVLQSVVPQRAKALGRLPGDLAVEWERFKEKWTADATPAEQP